MKDTYIVQSIAPSRCLAVALLLWTTAGSASIAKDVVIDACSLAMLAINVEVEDASAERTDIRVTVRHEGGDGSEEMLRIVARDELGEPVAMAPLPPALDGASVEVVLPGVLETVATRGLYYILQVEDVYGERVGAPFGVWTTLRCAAHGDGDVCHYELIKNVHLNGGIWVSPALRKALDKALAVGSEHVLGDVMQNQPALRGEVLAYALQRQYLVSQAAPGLGQPCECTWAVTESGVPLVPMPPADSLTMVMQDIGRGHVLAAQTHGVSRQLGFAEQAAVEARLDCGNVAAITTTTVEVGDAPIEIPLPVMAGCPPPCEGTVEHQFSYRTRLLAQVERVPGLGSGFGAPPAVASTFEILELEVDGLTVQYQPYTLSAQTQTPGVDIADCLFDRITETATRPQPSTAVATIQAGIDLEVEQTDNAFGRVAAAYGFRGYAYAVCAQPQVAGWGPLIIIEKDILIGNDN